MSSINEVSIDYMHCVLEGIAKKLCSLWLTPSANEYYIGLHSQLIDTVHSLMVLEGILHSLYLEHLALLLCSFHFLLCDRSTPSRCSRTKAMLQTFYEQYERLYGEITYTYRYYYTYSSNSAMTLHSFVGLHNCTMNVHLLDHLVDTVKRFGPLWTSSCFESVMGKLTRIRHGTQHIMQQVNRVEWPYIS